MKLEIEITEEEIKSAVERKVRTAIADQTNQWNVDDYIKKRVAESWKLAVDNLVAEQLADAPNLQAKIRSSIEAKLKGQLTAMMRGTK